MRSLLNINNETISLDLLYNVSDVFEDTFDGKWSIYLFFVGGSQKEISFDIKDDKYIHWLELAKKYRGGNPNMYYECIDKAQEVAIEYGKAKRAELIQLWRTKDTNEIGQFNIF